MVILKVLRAMAYSWVTECVVLVCIWEGQVRVSVPMLLSHGALAGPCAAPLFRTVRAASTFTSSYESHVAERAAEGLVPKPLSAKQVSDLVELLKNPPAGTRADMARPRRAIRATASKGNLGDCWGMRRARPQVVF